MISSADTEWTPPLDDELPPVEPDWSAVLVDEARGGSHPAADPSTTVPRSAAPSTFAPRSAAPSTNLPPSAASSTTVPRSAAPGTIAQGERGPLPFKERQAALDALHERIQACTACDLHRTRTRAVPGSGPASARIMAIGEAPGEREDIEGVPFVGAAGRLLTRLLTEAGIPREALYITNVLKSRPPGNRDPLPDEVAACAGFLEAQIDLLAPDVILLLGRHALLRVLPGAPPISRCHGQRLQRGSRSYIPLYHPAAALYNGSMLRTLEEDMRQVRGYLDEADETRRRTEAQAARPATGARSETDPETEAKPKPEARPETEMTADELQLQLF